MIKRSDELRVTNTENLQAGIGNIRIEHFFEEEDFHNIGRLLGISIIEPGNSIGYHKHINEQEFYFILEGEARYIDNEKEYILKPGDMSICKDGDSHSIECYGDKTLKYVAFIMYTNLHS